MSGETPMTTKQFTIALRDLGLSQVAFAKVIGLSDRTVRNYIAGQHAIPGPVVKLLHLATSGRVSVDEIDAA
jgi:DNA-binding transcriptional regulator YiaG